MGTAMSGGPEAVSREMVPGEAVFRGIVASSGLAVGRLWRVASTPLLLDRPSEGAAAERARLRDAIAAVVARLDDTVAGADADTAPIVEFQAMLLRDPELSAPAFAAIERGLSANRAWHDALEAEIAGFAESADPYFSGRTTDLIDLQQRVLLHLSGGVAPPAEDVRGDILVFDDLTPTRFLDIDWSRFRALALVGGSLVDHVTMLARARRVPMLVGLDPAVAAAAPGTPMVLDAQEGLAILHPSPATLAGIGERRDRLAVAEARDEREVDRPAALPNGEAVTILTNLDDWGALGGMAVRRCGGVGLGRTEFLFQNGVPDEEQQFAAYSRLLAWAEGRPVTIRTLDAGGDKPIAGVSAPFETNPFLGLRGVRLSLVRPDLFRTQIRALVRAAVRSDLRVLVPMVTVPEEMQTVRALFAAEVLALRAAGVPAALPRIGMMVEVPAAALSISSFQADFFSIGTNDLIQYTAAASRDALALRALQSPSSAAVLELIRRVADDGRRRGIEVSVCGEMAADARHVGLILDAGIRCLSVPYATIGPIKAAVRAHGLAGGPA